MCRRDRDEKYQVVKRSNKSGVSTAASKYTYSKLDDVRKFLDDISGKYTDNVINDTTVGQLRDCLLYTSPQYPADIPGHGS